MQSEMGKLFIGGISWDTSEEHLKEFFGGYGEVLEAVIMKDRCTGRSRGFGFVVFSDSAVADRVIKEKHNIDGRLVEAKRAVPRDDNNSVISRSSSSIQGSPSPLRTKKIFVGGLASTVTESDFKVYFEQFGTITDVVVMYDHNTQRPRGFGFITYDSEEAVDKVLFKTFHELNGKMVEVKRAVPKELSSSPIRSPLGGYNYGVNKINDLLNGYTQGGFSPNSVGGYGRFSPISGGRNAFGPLGNSYGMGLNLNFEHGSNPSFGGSPNFSGGMNYGRGGSPYYTGNSNRIENTVGFGSGGGGDTSFFSSGSRNLWENGGLNHGIGSTNLSDYLGSIGSNSGVNWGSTSISPQRGVGNISSHVGNLGYGGGDNSYGRNVRAIGTHSSSYAQSNSGYDRGFSGMYGGGSVQEDPTCRSTNFEREGSGSFGYGIAGGLSDGPADMSLRFVSGYNMIRDI